MPVNTSHQDVTNMAPVWQRCRDVYDGQQAIHGARKQTYLPMFKDESQADYDARLKRSLFFNAFFRTVQGLAGMLLLAPPKVKVSPVAESMLADITQSGQTLDDVADEVGIEALVVGRVGLLTDYPRPPGGEALTVAAAERLGLRPKWAVYKAESIINWAHRWVSGRHQLALVVLAETYSPPGGDRFSPSIAQQCRVLELDEDGYYRVEIWREDAKGEWLPVPEETTWPTIGKERMREIPFVVIGADSTRAEVELPPLVDLVNVNISHYQSTSDAEHGAHKTAMPQPWIAGMEIGMDQHGSVVQPTFYMGGGVWTLPQGATVGMLEYSGQGLAAIEARISAKVEMMAVLGARMLEAQKKAAETAEAAGLHRSGEQSALTRVAETIDSGFRRALGWFDRWAGGSGDVEFSLNKDFIPSKLTPEELLAYVAAYQAGRLSPQEFYALMQGGGLVDPDKPYEEHEAQLEAAPPAVAPVAAPAAGGADE